MKKLLANLGDLSLSKEQMKQVKGGVWCYSATCECGGGSFGVPPGDLNNYRETVSYYCSSGNPVNCSFQSC
ncbi:hypothetical protein [Emticicia fontis]